MGCRGARHLADRWRNDPAHRVGHSRDRHHRRRGGPVSATRTVTGLTVGREYTASVWVNPDSSTGVTDLTLGVTGIGTATPVAPGTGYQQLTYEFTATATSHDLVVGYEAADDVGSLLMWDDVTVTEDAWVETTVAARARSRTVWCGRSRVGSCRTPSPTPLRRLRRRRRTRSMLRVVSTTAVIPHHTLTYGYGTASCGIHCGGEER